MIVHGNERWWLADRTAAFLEIDRDVCRRAFYREPPDLVSAVVDAVRSWEDDPDYDPEERIEGWARKEGAGIFDKDRRGEGDLTHTGEIMANDLLELAARRPKLDPELDYHLYLICIRLEEERLGRALTPSQSEQFAREFYAPNYRQSMASIRNEQWDELFAELEQESARTRKKRPPRRRAG